MTQAASQAAAFYRDVAKARRLWTVRDDRGFPTSTNASGEQAQPFWSSRSRVEKIIETVPAYAGFAPVEISWSDFCEAWVPGMTADTILVGVNWSGGRALGYDLPARDVQRNVEAVIAAAPES